MAAVRFQSCLAYWRAQLGSDPGAQGGGGGEMRNRRPGDPLPLNGRDRDWKRAHLGWPAAREGVWDTPRSCVDSKGG